MSIDIAKFVVATNSGKDGATSTCINGNKILPAFDSRQRIVPKINKVITDTVSFAKLDNRF